MHPIVPYLLGSTIISCLLIYWVATALINLL